jgi:hypothetical protein
MLLKYVKIGKGRLWHCWKARIVEDHCLHEGSLVKCSCGTLIGIDEGKWIKLKQHAFTYSGTHH